ncbi:MAG TPA: membrane dipeptidase [Solirubrobacteraceae bacterium]|nr:membrane dipeptidase [Solirubrobacteraceae bacterium]
MLVDMHAHYPMHVLDETPHAGIPLGRWRAERLRAGVVDLISRFANYEGPGDTPSVTMDLIREGGVGVVLSVLYQPFDEIDPGAAFGEPPGPGAPGGLLDQLATVEAEIESGHARVALVVRSRADLDRALAEGLTAMVHCVEGGFALGADGDQVRRTVAALARHGVAYVTLAHLFWRRVATNAPALPFLSDRVYHLLFRQPRREGLGELGRTAVDALVAHRVLIDVTHMSRPALAETLDRLDGDPRARGVPVIASHGACDLGHGPEYNLGRDAVVRIAARGGVIGLIDCAHYLAFGARRPPATLDQSVEVVCRHIDRLAEWTGGFDHVAIGTDLDGYIKPALAGLKDAGALRELERRLGERYGPADAEKICSANALRMLHYRYPPA